MSTESAEPLWTVWLDSTGHVASFHPEEGYVEQCFRNHTFFLEFLQDLQTQGYRFQ